MLEEADEEATPNLGTDEGEKENVDPEIQNMIHDADKLLSTIHDGSVSIKR